jgi:RNA-splicing ligase RtcB
VCHWEEVDEVVEAEELLEILDDEGCEVVESMKEEMRAVEWGVREFGELFEGNDEMELVDEEVTEEEDEMYTRHIVS